MKIEVYMKAENRVVGIYEVKDFATTDLSSWPFKDGTDVSFDELTTYVESIKREFKAPPEASKVKKQTSVPTVDLVEGSSEDEIELVKENKRPVDDSGITGRHLSESESVDNTHESRSDIEQDVLNKEENSDSNIQIPQNAPIAQAVHPEPKTMARPVLANDRSHTEKSASDLREDLRLAKKVEAYLPPHILAQLHASSVFRSMDDPTATRLSVNLLFEKVIEELQRNHRPPELYNVRIVE